MRNWIFAGLCVIGPAAAQSFPQEFGTGDDAVASALRRTAERLAEEGGSLSTRLRLLISLPANRVYRQMNAQARVAALEAALPVVKRVAMSEALQKEHDERIALLYGAVDHGLRLQRRLDPAKRFEEMSRQIDKNPAVMQKPGFMEEFVKVQQEAASAGEAEMVDSMLNRFTRPLQDMVREFERERQEESEPEVRRCYYAAAPLASSNPDRFRLQFFRCGLLRYGAHKTEAEADQLRKERAQRLYDERSLRGVIIRSLREFLDTAATVDFAAQTTKSQYYDAQVFVNPAYEKKSDLWKLIYRNGKEPTDVAVRFAKAWLAELAPAAPAAAPSGPAGAAKPAPPRAAPKK